MEVLLERIGGWSLPRDCFPAPSSPSVNKLSSRPTQKHLQIRSPAARELLLSRAIAPPPSLEPRGSGWHSSWPASPRGKTASTRRLREPHMASRLPSRTLRTPLLGGLPVGLLDRRLAKRCDQFTEKLQLSELSGERTHPDHRPACLLSWSRAFTMAAAAEGIYKKINVRLVFFAALVETSEWHTVSMRQVRCAIRLKLQNHARPTGVSTNKANGSSHRSTDLPLLNRSDAGVPIWGCTSSTTSGAFETMDMTSTTCLDRPEAVGCFDPKPDSTQVPE